ncbi:MAG: ABC transporter substrate-binding protein [Spirochaetales bacterium]|nr:ABC transporter substrate-binding protein [Spirochaetales bacterium]
MNLRNYIVFGLFFIGFFGIGPGAFAGGRQDSSASPGQIVIGYQAIPNGELVAKNLGWHEERLGVPIRWVQFNSGSELNNAIASGSVDLGLGGSSTTVAAIAQGVPAEVIWIYDIIGDNEALVVRRDSGIETLSDLQGKKVAAPFGATTHYHLMVALELEGIDPASLTIFDMPPADMRAAWIRGDIDAAFVWEPTLASLLDLEGKILITSGELASKGFLTGDIGIVRKGFAEEFPEYVQGYLESQIKSIEFIRNTPQLASEAIGMELGLSVDEARRQMNSLVFLSGAEQLGSEYLGKTGAPGNLAEVFYTTAQFLVDQQRIRDLPDLEIFQNALVPLYLEGALHTLGD